MVTFLALGIAYATASLLADGLYGVGIRTGDLRAFDLAAKVFPLARTRRTGPAYARIFLPDQTTPAETAVVLKAALATDPNAADLWYHLARTYLQLGDREGYTTAYRELKRLTPHVVYSEVPEPATKERP